MYAGSSFKLFPSKNASRRDPYNPERPELNRCTRIGSLPLGNSMGKSGVNMCFCVRNTTDPVLRPIGVSINGSDRPVVSHCVVCQEPTK